jgi:peptidoglycan/LPS O-acetylase OafA/YrhL
MTAGIGSIGSLDTSLEVELHHASLNIPGSISQLLHKAGPSNELANMDLFRTFAVLLVFIGHLFVFLRIRGLGDIGHLGVLFFFVHTSLVLMLSMDRLGLTGSSLYGVFVLRRVFRIYPLSVLGVVVALALHVPSAPWLGGYVFPGWYAVLSNILLIQNIAGDGSIICVLWSLPFEIQMYAFLPISYIFLSRFRSIRAVSLIWLAVSVVAALEYFVRAGSVDREFILSRYAPCFLAGVFAWRLMARRRRLRPATLWPIALIVLITLYRLEDAFRVYGSNWMFALGGRSEMTTNNGCHTMWI